MARWVVERTPARSAELDRTRDIVVRTFRNSGGIDRLTRGDISRALSRSSRGLGQRPLTAPTGVRIPYGTPDNQHTPLKYQHIIASPRAVPTIVPTLCVRSPTRSDRGACHLGTQLHPGNRNPCSTPSVGQRSSWCFVAAAQPNIGTGGNHLEPIHDHRLMERRLACCPASRIRTSARHARRGMEAGIPGGESLMVTRVVSATTIKKQLRAMVGYASPDWDQGSTPPHRPMQATCARSSSARTTASRLSLLVAMMIAFAVAPTRNGSPWVARRQPERSNSGFLQPRKRDQPSISPSWELFSALAMPRSCNLGGYPNRKCPRTCWTSSPPGNCGSQWRPADQESGIFCH